MVAPERPPSPSSGRGLLIWHAGRLGRRHVESGRAGRDAFEHALESFRDGFERAIADEREDVGEGLRDSRLILQIGMLLGFVYVGFLSVWVWATRLRGTDRPELCEVKDESHREPDQHEDHQDPEQERRLADRQPRQLALAHDEQRPPPGDPVLVVENGLAADGSSRVIRRAPLGVGVRHGGKSRAGSGRCGSPSASPMKLRIPPPLSPSPSPGRSRMTRAFLMAWLLALTVTSSVVFALSRGDGAAAQLPVPTPAVPAPGVPAPTPVLRIGDTMRVEGAAMGCQVTRRGGRPVIECRRDGTVSGTYGTFMSDRTLKVARFHSSHTAQTVFTARHGGGWRACARTARRSRAAAVSRGCR